MIENQPTSPSGGASTTAAALVELCRRTPPPGHNDPRRGSTHALAGPYLSSFRGGGIEFDELRAYQPGDDVRSIDWRVTARTGRPHSRVFREDHEQPVWLLTDLGPAMRFGTRRAFKSVAAAEASALLSWWSVEAGDRVGGFVLGEDRCVAHPPRGQQARHWAFLQALAKATEPREAKDEEDNTAVSLDAALGRLATAVHPGSRVFIISDFEGLGPAGRRHLIQLARWCDVRCVLVYDVLEAHAPPNGEYRIHDGSGSRAITVGGRRPRQDYEDLFHERVEELRQFCQAHRVELMALRTDENPGDVLSPARPQMGGRS